MMNRRKEDLGQADEGHLPRDEVSDQALEAASVTWRGFPTLPNTYCFACPSRPTLGGQAAHQG